MWNPLLIWKKRSQLQGMLSSWRSPIEPGGSGDSWGDSDWNDHWWGRKMRVINAVNDASDSRGKLLWETVSRGWGAGDGGGFGVFVWVENSQSHRTVCTVCCRFTESILLPCLLGCIPSLLNREGRSQSRLKLSMKPMLWVLLADWSQVWRLRSLLKRPAPWPRVGMDKIVFSRLRLPTGCVILPQMNNNSLNGCREWVQ